MVVTTGPRHGPSLQSVHLCRLRKDLVLDRRNRKKTFTLTRNARFPLGTHVATKQRTTPSGGADEARAAATCPDRHRVGADVNPGLAVGGAEERFLRRRRECAVGDTETPPLPSFTPRCPRTISKAVKESVRMGAPRTRRLPVVSAANCGGGVLCPRCS